MANHSNSFYYGVYERQNDQVTPEERLTLRSKLAPLKGVMAEKHVIWWKWFDKRDWRNDSQPWIEIVEGKMVKRFEKCISEITSFSENKNV